MHESIINSAKLEDFQPLNMPDPPRPLRAILPEYADVTNPRSFFNMFVKIEDLELIVANINKYAKAYPGRYQVMGINEWKETNINEIKVYLAILIYIGLYRLSNPCTH
jgi:hypothetical protein